MVTSLILVALGVLVVSSIAGWMGFGFARTEKLEKRRYLSDEAERAAALFRGGEKIVIYDAPDASGGIPTDRLISAGAEQGYLYKTETGRMASRRVVFEQWTPTMA